MIRAPRTFLVTVYEAPSAVLEDLATGRREHVADIAALEEHVSRALAEVPGSDGRAGQDTLLEGDGSGRGLDAELVDERPSAGEKLP
jgi:hypothetical protein